MIKPRCQECNGTYLGEGCPCREGGRPKALECECGKPAVEIYIDRLGEWPLCRDCLRLEQNDFAPMPLPDYREAIDPDPCDVLPAIGQDFMAIEAQKTTALPFGLTGRELEIALKAHLTNKQIAEELMISVETVKTHLRSIFCKLCVHSKSEIKSALQAWLAGEQGGRGACPSPTLGASVKACKPLADARDKGGGAGETAESTAEEDKKALAFTLTITGRVDSLGEILKLLSN